MGRLGLESVGCGLLLLAATFGNFASAGEKSMMPKEAVLLVNQIGYELEGAKRFLLQVPHELADEELEFLILDGENKVRFTGKLSAPAEIASWGYWYRAGSFTVLDEPGVYRVSVTLGGKTLLSHPFEIGTDIIVRRTGFLVSRFFYYERCGYEVPGWHKVCHLDDGRMPDGTHVDLAGGWHDAGDCRKWPCTMSFPTFALARYADSKADKLGSYKNLQGAPLRPPVFADAPSAQESGYGYDEARNKDPLCVHYDEKTGALYSLGEDEYPSPVEEATWGALALRKWQDKQTGLIIGYLVKPPSSPTDNIIGTDDDRLITPSQGAGGNNNRQTIAAYARLSVLTKDKQWLKHGTDLWEKVKEHKGTPQGSAWLLLADIHLYQVTREKRFEENARECALDLVNLQRDDGTWELKSRTDLLVYRGTVPAALAEYLLVFPTASERERVRTALSRYVQFWRRCSENPFGIMEWDGSAYFCQPRWMGQNSFYISQVWAMLLIDRALGGDKDAKALVQGTIDWVLGVNPYGVCMLQGAGSVNVPHQHVFGLRKIQIQPPPVEGRSQWLRNLPGAIVNGIYPRQKDTDKPWLDMQSASWQTNEPWVPHNAHWLLMLRELCAQKGN